MDQIQWEAVPDETSSFFTRDVFVKCSAAHHILHGIVQSPWPPVEQISADVIPEENNANKLIKWSPLALKRVKIDGVGNQGKVNKIDLPRPFPQKSVLTVIEQKDYLFALIRLTRAFSKGVAHDPNDVIIIKETQSKMKEEIQQFQQLAQSIMMQDISFYDTLVHGVERYVTEAWQSRLSRVQTYPCYYNTRGTATLIPKEMIKSIELVLEKNVLEMGRIPSQIFFQLNNTSRLKRSYQEINRRFPANSSTSNDSDPNCREPNSIKIAEKYGAEIIISSVGMKSLAGNVGPLFKESWETPFHVKTATINGETKKMIYMDDPLPPKKMSAVEKNCFFNDYAVRFHFTNMNWDRFYTYPGSEKMNPRKASTRPRTGEVFDPYEMDHSDLETFSVENSPSKTPSESTKETCNENPIVNAVEKSEKPVVNTIEKSDNESMSNNSDSDESLKIDLGDLSVSPRKSKRIQSKAKPPSPVKIKEKPTPSSSSSNLLSSILKGQEKMMQTSQKKNPAAEAENPADYVPPDRNKNVTYRLWNLRVNNQRSLRLLVRSSVDTAVTNAGGKFQTFVMYSKSEYQPWYGAECMTLRQWNERWMDSYLRPECKICSVRLDAYTGDLIMMEQKSAACMASEAALLYGEPLRYSKCLQSVWAVLSSLRDMDLSEGSYLLQHGADDGICVKVLSSSEDRESSSYDLHREYEIDTSVTAPADPGSCWIPLDPWTVTPVQRALFRAPLTFESAEMTDVVNTAAKRKKGNQTQKKKKAKTE